MFRFTIRDVLWLTVVVALAVGWGIESHRLASRQQEIASLRALTNYLSATLQSNNPAAKIEITVNGESITTDTTW